MGEGIQEHFRPIAEACREGDERSSGGQVFEPRDIDTYGGRKSYGGEVRSSLDCRKARQLCKGALGKMAVPAEAITA